MGAAQLQFNVITHHEEYIYMNLKNIKNGVGKVWKQDVDHAPAIALVLLDR